MNLGKLVSYLYSWKTVTKTASQQGRQQYLQLGSSISNVRKDEVMNKENKIKGF